jgi:hypothetical protein
MTRAVAPPAERVTPANDAAEAALLGAMLVYPSAIRSALPVVTSSSFFRPSHGHVFSAIAAVYGRGEPVDHVTVATELRNARVLDAVGGESVLTSLKAGAVSPQSAARGAAVVAEAATLRRLIAVAGEVLELAYAFPSDVPGTVERARAMVADVALELPVVSLPASLRTLEDLVSQSPLEPDWLIPGLVARGCKHLLVAPEGYGKTYVLRAFVALASQGLYPFAPTDHRAPGFEPIRALAIDAENPEFVVAGAFSAMLDQVRPWVPKSEYEAGRAWSWTERRRLNLRTGRDRATLHRVIEAVHPDLVCLGPLYKLFQAGSNERSERAAEDLADVFDDVIDRYGLSLLLEHHAPKAPAGSKRDLDPFGSQRWLAWPDIGIKLVPVDEGNTLEVRRFRGDRYRLSWPDTITRGKSWPWEATWQNAGWMDPSKRRDDPGPREPDPYDQEPF